MQKIYISCPNCGWEPDETCIWVCSVCKTRWNTFETNAQCPTCGKVYEDTQCIKSKGGCGEMSPNKDWYTEYTALETQPASSIFSLWKKKKEYPVTENDKVWIEESLLWLADTFDPVYFKSLFTITFDKEFSDHKFNYSHEDADFIFNRLTDLMNINGWEIQLMFFSEKSTEFSEGIHLTRSEKLKDRWKSSPTKFVDNGFGNKEIWI